MQRLYEITGVALMIVSGIGFTLIEGAYHLNPTWIPVFVLAGLFGLGLVFNGLTRTATAKGRSEDVPKMGLLIGTFLLLALFFFALGL